MGQAEASRSSSSRSGWRGGYRISVARRKAAVPKVPVNNDRLKYMAVTPLGVLFIVLGLFLAQEIVSSRASASEATTEPSPRE